MSVRVGVCVDEQRNVYEGVSGATPQPLITLNYYKPSFAHYTILFLGGVDTCVDKHSGMMHYSVASFVC